MRPNRWIALAVAAVAATTGATTAGALATSASRRIHFTSYQVGVFSNVHAIAIDPRHHRVYAANGNGTADVLNESTGRLLEYPVGEGPSAIAVDPGRGAAYIAAAGSDEIDILNSHGVARVVHLPTGSTPSAVYVDSSRHVAYVAESGTDRLTMVQAGKRIGSIPVGDDPSAIAADESSGLLYVANAGSGTVTVVRRAAVVGTVDVGDGPSAIAVNPRTHLAYVTDETSADVSILQKTTLVTSITLPAGSRPSSVDVAPAINVAYVSMTGVFGDDDTCQGAGAAVISGQALSTLHPAGSSEDCLGPVLVDRKTSSAFVSDFYDGRQSLFLHKDQVVEAKNLPYDIGFGVGADEAGSDCVWLPSDAYLYRLRMPFGSGHT